MSALDFPRPLHRWHARAMLIAALVSIIGDGARRLARRGAA